ncbi:MAG: polymerase sigma factor FliA, partial [Blastococcus sp.]|nr:polymerase sigma factor FliA [Blastococcus sp.]
MSEATIHRIDESDEDTDALLAQLWIDYVDSREGGLRDRLILHYAPLV